MQNQVGRGALLLIFSELLLAVMAAMVKHVSQDLPPEVVTFFRNLLGLAVLLPFLLQRGGLHAMATRRLGGHLIRAVAGLAAMYCYFYTIAHIPLAEAVLVKMTTPFLMPLIAWLWLGDRIGARTLLAIMLGFVGVSFVLRPVPGHFDPVHLVALAGAALMSVAMVGIRSISDTEPPRRTVFWFGVFSSLISAVPLLWVRPLPGPEHWPWLVAIGVVATAAQITMTTAYKLASPGRIGIYNYTSVVWAALLGLVFWAEALHWSTLVGTALIFAAGVWNLERKGRVSAAHDVPVVSSQTAPDKSSGTRLS
ncbi:hypothetical protein S7S_09710 [Isoalcanivorax pacificus W11-5]|jgi:drug/metabolite transporter (DMT)-like permease|uniref:EamA domain-containing protein n=1 Tax=Isoalcanivorax pacificus W11-5 TaxID=391936 RepID=A0A0B4XJ84_9GAMM|nr:EamA family transporter [Isoalcanivorax pacificus]AJD48354.1 hypothetical protein S7S_09710 [Isoalcanivorax pacificus W11-5]